MEQFKEGQFSKIYYGSSVDNDHYPADNCVAEMIIEVLIEGGEAEFAIDEFSDMLRRQSVYESLESRWILCSGSDQEKRLAEKLSMTYEEFKSIHSLFDRISSFFGEDFGPRVNFL